jgi:hypothetical protein
LIPLPQPFYVVPLDGSDPMPIDEAPQDMQVRPMLGVGLITPYIAQKWLRAGPPVFYPVVVVDLDDFLIAGHKTLREAEHNPKARKPAAIVKLGQEQASTAYTAVTAMRMAFDQPESEDVEALILSDAGGRVLGGAEALYDLRQVKVMLVLITEEPTAEAATLAAAPMN